MRSKRIAYPGAAVTALLLTTLTACTPDQSVDPPPSDPSNLSSSVSPTISRPSASPSASPTSTDTAAADTDLIKVNDVSEVIPYVAGDACTFPVSVTAVSKETIYDDGEQAVSLFADESLTITNTDNKKVFDATGDGVTVNDFNDDRSQADSRLIGFGLHIGEFTLPGNEKRQTGIVFIKGGAEAAQHNMFTNDHWVEFTKFTGTPIDVCAELT